jgi:hypothetical protein
MDNKTFIRFGIKFVLFRNQISNESHIEGGDKKKSDFFKVRGSQSKY